MTELGVESKQSGSEAVPPALIHFVLPLNISLLCGHKKVEMKLNESQEGDVSRIPILPMHVKPTVKNREGSKDLIFGKEVKIWTHFVLC